MHVCPTPSTAHEPVAGPSPRRVARSRRTVAALTVSAGLLAALAPAAEAATSAGSAPGSTTLTINAAAGHANVITVQRPGQFSVQDTSDTITPGPGCVAVTPHIVSCASAGITTVVVRLDNLNDVLTYNGAGVRGSLDGGSGDDVIQLGPAAPSSSLFGGADNDRLIGGPGNDQFDGGPGSDRFTGAGGADLVDYRNRVAPVIADIDGVRDDGAAGELDDIQLDIENIYGGSAADVLGGSGAANQLVGGAGNDRLAGGFGDDSLVGNAGNDIVDGGAGNDRAVAEPVVDGNDRFGGGPGTDTTSYAARATPVSVTLNGIANDGAPGEADNNLADVENASGGSANDILVGNALANNLFGSGGNDQLGTIDGIGGNDTANGGYGVDNCLTDPGDVLISC